MTKNMTRKGLALGSSFALVASAVVGFAAPAQASSLDCDPKLRYLYYDHFGRGFSVKVLGQFAATDDLQWEIAGIDTANETVTATVSGGQAVLAPPRRPLTQPLLLPPLVETLLQLQLALQRPVQLPFVHTLSLVTQLASTPPTTQATQHHLP